jgi:CheY-like chemotaxis protein
MDQRKRNNQHDPIRVLVADDSADARLLLETFLEHLGCEVCAVANGREAVTRAARFKPDVVLLDLWMPEMDGHEACLRLRADSCPPPVPIFAVTADVTQSESAVECFDRVLTKPVDLEGLGKLVLREEGEVALH